MTDIVERLRAEHPRKALMVEAADEIDRLRAEVKYWSEYESEAWLAMKAKIERLRGELDYKSEAVIPALRAEIERLRADLLAERDTRDRNDARIIREQRAEIERLRAALADVLPLAERYVGRSDGQPNAIYDCLANARRALENKSASEG